MKRALPLVQDAQFNRWLRQHEAEIDSVGPLDFFF